MRITRVSYQQLRSFGNFQNERIGAESTVEIGESPEAVLAHVKAWVEGQLNQRVEYAAMQQEHYRLQNEIAMMERRLKGARQALGIGDGEGQTEESPF